MQVLSALQQQESAPVSSDALGLNRLSQHLLLTIHRRRASFDWLLQNICQARPRPRIRRLLWWAMAEIFWFDGVPVPAVVDTAVAYCKRQYSPSEAGFLNACLRTLSTAHNTHSWDDLLAKAPEHVRLELPKSLWRRWRQNFSAADLSSLSKTLLLPADTVFRLRCWPPRQVSIPPELQPIPSPDWSPEAKLFVASNLAEGKLNQLMSPGSPFYIQDPATLLAPELLSAKPGEQVTDLCAAPGGKAVLLAEAMQGQGKLICYDRSAGKLPRLRENLADFPHVSVLRGDAGKALLPVASQDAILLDVPCSNTGVIRRRPDARWTFSLQKLRELVNIQANILAAAATALKPGGRLVYSTCSIEKEENEQQITAFLNSHPDFQCTSQQLLLPTSTHDGAFAALLHKKSF